MYLRVVYARVDDVEPDWLEEQRADAVEEDEDGHEEHEHLQWQEILVMISDDICIKDRVE